jgi:GNAT superfamily N-acetyltransferase
MTNSSNHKIEKKEIALREHGFKTSWLYQAVDKNTGKEAGRILLSKKDDVIYIELLSVEQKHRGKGLGRMLLEEVFKDDLPVYLDVLSPMAKKFYLHMGFDFDGPDGMSIDPSSPTIHSSLTLPDENECEEEFSLYSSPLQ